jgi:hypothetical protein
MFWRQARPKRLSSPFPSTASLQRGAVFLFADLRALRFRFGDRAALNLCPMLRWEIYHGVGRCLIWEDAALHAQGWLTLYRQRGTWQIDGDLRLGPMCDPQAAAALALAAHLLSAHGPAPKIRRLQALGVPVLKRVSRCTEPQIRRWLGRPPPRQRNASGPSTAPHVGSRHDCSRAAIFR